MDATDSHVSASLERRTEAFRRRFVMVIAGVLLLFGLTGVLVYATVGAEGGSIATVAVTTVTCLVTLMLSFGGRADLGARVLLAGLVGSAAVTLFRGVGGAFAVGTLQTLFLVAFLAPFLLPRAYTIGTVLAAMLVVLGAFAKGLAVGEVAWADAGPMGMGTSILLAAVAAMGVVFVRHSDENLGLLRMRLDDIEVVMERARRIAAGDLTGDVDGEGDVPKTVRSMLTNLREMVGQIQETSAQLASATQEIGAMARQQEESAVEQSSAVEETRRTIEAMLGSSREIASSARGVAENAEATLDNARTIDESLDGLRRHTDRIAEILDVIKDIANKSELLALNAALEGAKAEEAGRGFSLVAARMQRLAEDVMASVRDVKTLTDDIRGATRATTEATAGATRIAADTTEAAHRISAVTRDQERSTEEVTRAMNDIASAATQTSAGTNQTLQAARDLSHLAERLGGLVQRFQV
ncbi:MAG: hypothetical protein SangKO_087170 [Sandaracinaceae bacterium]